MTAPADSGEAGDLLKRQTLELWEERFERLLKAEAESRGTYGGILVRFSHLLAGSRVKNLVRQLRKEEGRHIEIAKQLLEIVRQEKNR